MRTRVVAVVGVVVVSLLVASCSSGTARTSPATTLPVKGPPTTARPVAAPDPRPAPLRWSACPENGGFDCARLTVPVDYAHPDGPKIELAVIRRLAPDPGPRVRTLILNPGGPGVSGRQLVLGGFGRDNGMAADFDLVSWDTRGSGESAPIRCDGHAAAYDALDPNPSSPAGLAALETAAGRVAADCGAHGGLLLRHMDTDTTVRDLEQLRLALGGAKLNYAGYSYGTAIGLAYARRYPTHIRAMVLDGVVPANWDLPHLLVVEATGAERRLGEILGCATAGACRPGSAGAAYDLIARALARGRPPAGLGPAVSNGDLVTAAAMSVYDPGDADAFLLGLEQLIHGDSAGIVGLANRYRSEVTSEAAYLGVTCTDFPHPRGAAAAKAFMTLVHRFPRLGGFVAEDLLSCANWPAPVSRTVGVVRAPDAPRILVVGNTGDPVTPLANSVAVAGELAHGVLLTLDGQGHTSVTRSTCIAGAELRYLTQLVTPPPGTVCAS